MFPNSLITALVITLFQLGLIICHPHPGFTPLRSDVSCSDHPPAQSYHIHILFWQNNKNSTDAAIKLQNDFMSQFNITAERNTCAFGPGDIEPEASMCVFPTNFSPAGPFVTGNTGIFIPVVDYERSISWLIPRRGYLDVFIHPNSGCSPNDHLFDALWAGNKWELDPSIFAD
jgi:aromatic ring-cleaving dioxygenase